jgi:hypothetical protein
MLEEPELRLLWFSRSPMHCRGNREGATVMNVHLCRVLRSLLVIAALMGGTVSADAFVPPASVTFETTSVAAGIGMSWGNGRLRFEGRSYGFSIDGVTFVDFGLSKTTAAGRVYNLKDLADFEGTYFAGEADFAVGGGLGGTWLRNQNGVAIHLQSVTQGARLQLGTAGVKIQLWIHR